MSVAIDILLQDRKLNLRRRYTYGELGEIIGETNQPHELWHGRLLMEPPPSCSHQEIVLRFCVRLLGSIQKGRLGRVYMSPVDMVLSPDCSVQPDVAFLFTENLFRVRKRIHGPADLIAEVLSPNGRSRDLIKKRDLYEEYGVPEYWVIDPKNRAIVLFGLSSERHYEILGRYPEGKKARSRLLEGFSVDVASLFGD